jgi:hypothetical protein
LYEVATMSMIYRRAYFAAALLLCMTGCGREPQSSAENQVQPAAVATPAAQPVPLAQGEATPPVPPATELRIERIASVMVRRDPDVPGTIVIRASGSVASAGWSGVRLTPVEDESASETLLVFSFVATSPEALEGSSVRQTVQTDLRVDNVPPEVRTIRVVSATNAISAPIIQ